MVHPGFVSPTQFDYMSLERRRQRGHVMTSRQVLVPRSVQQQGQLGRPGLVNGRSLAFLKDIGRLALETDVIGIRAFQCQHLPQQYGHGVDVAFVIVGHAQGDFGGHVGNCARRGCQVKERVVRLVAGNGGSDFFREAKVKEFNVVVNIVTDIVGFEIAIHNTNE